MCEDILIHGGPTLKHIGLNVTCLCVRYQRTHSEVLWRCASMGQSYFGSKGRPTQYQTGGFNVVANVFTFQLGKLANWSAGRSLFS